MCKAHRSYNAARRPLCKCDACWAMWEAKTKATNIHEAKKKQVKSAPAGEQRPGLTMIANQVLDAVINWERNTAEPIDYKTLKSTLGGVSLGRALPTLCRLGLLTKVGWGRYGIDNIVQSGQQARTNIYTNRTITSNAGLTTLTYCSH